VSGFDYWAQSESEALTFWPPEAFLITWVARPVAAEFRYHIAALRSMLRMLRPGELRLA